MTNILHRCIDLLSTQQLQNLQKVVAASDIDIKSQLCYVKINGHGHKLKYQSLGFTDFNLYWLTNMTRLVIHVARLWKVKSGIKVLSQCS